MVGVLGQEQGDGGAPGAVAEDGKCRRHQADTEPMRELYRRPEIDSVPPAVGIA